MKKVFHFLWHERKKIFLFFIVGGLSFGIWFLIYYFLSRHIWVSGNHTLENFIAVIISAGFNFFAHRHWTFEAHEHKHTKQLPRYFLVLGSAMGFQAFLFWLGHEFFGFYDFAVVVVVTGLVAIYTYISHRFFTFHHKKELV